MTAAIHPSLPFNWPLTDTDQIQYYDEIRQKNSEKFKDGNINLLMDKFDK